MICLDGSSSGLSFWGTPSVPVGGTHSSIPIPPGPSFKRQACRHVRPDVRFCLICRISSGLLSCR